MDGRYSGASKRGARSDGFAYSAAEAAILARPSAAQSLLLRLVAVSGARSVDPAGARRFGLLATDLGFRLSDLTMLLLAAWLSGVSGDRFDEVLSTIAALLIANLVFSVRGIYRDGAFFLRRLGIQRLAVAWWHAFGFWVIVLLLGSSIADLVLPGRLLPFAWFAPARLAQFFVGGLVTVVAGRLALRWLFELGAVESQMARRTCVIGTGLTGRRVAAELCSRHDPTIQVLGFIDDGEVAVPAPGTDPDLPVLGGIDALVGLIGRSEVDMVLVATPWTAHQRIEEIMRRLASLPVSVGLVPEQIPFQFPHRLVQSAAGIPILQVCEQRFSDWARFVKKFEDMVLASLLLLVLAPLMALVAVAIKLDSPGPVLFSQRRYGIGSRIIEVHKFRTMHTHMSDMDCEQQTVRADPRLTRVGAVLRRYSLDELPQLFNVLTGEMSIVGPRPHALSTKAEGQLFEDAVVTYMARHRVKPGITGWAQVNGWRGETDTLEKIARRVEHDLYYIGNWSPALDMFILLRTARVVFKDDNAF